MKLMICGKGGSGKSTVAALLAKALEKRGSRVLLVDADESNIGLYRMMGTEAPPTLLEAMGGKKGFNEKLKASKGEGFMAGPPVFAPGLTLDNLPEGCAAVSGGVRVVSTGKIHHFGEGCACPMGNLFRAFFSALTLGPQDLVLVDTAAGLEHFGRRLDGECDHIACVVSPSFESVTMAKRMAAIATEANLPFSVILNSMTPETLPGVEAALEGMDILGTLSHSQKIFIQTLNGEAIDPDLPGISDLAGALGKLARS